jgi:hypothetical protein
MKRHYALFLILWASGFWLSLKAADELDPNNYRSIHWSYYDGNMLRDRHFVITAGNVLL